MASFATLSLLLVANLVAFLEVAATSASSVPQEVYWDAVLPKTAMPSVLRRLLHTEVKTPYSLQELFISLNQKSGNNEGFVIGTEQKRSIASIWKNEGAVLSPEQKKSMINGVWKNEGLLLSSEQKRSIASIWKNEGAVRSPEQKSMLNIIWKNEGILLSSEQKSRINSIWKDEGIILSSEQKSRISSIWKNEGILLSQDNKNKINTIWKDAKDERDDDINVSDYILHRDLHLGAKMQLHVHSSSARSGFLPRDDADSITVSFAELPQILTRFSVRPDSVEAKAIRTSMVICEEGPVDDGNGCTASLESMVEFAITRLGTFKVKARSTKAIKRSSVTKQQYSIISVRRMGGKKAVVCHPLAYPYALFYCHLIHENTEPYKVVAVGQDGSMVDAVVVCHMDTSKWDPNHDSLLALKEKPGAPVCHFLSRDNVIWTPVAEEVVEMEDQGATTGISDA